MEEFKFLQKKKNREIINTELITPQWKKRFIEENYHRIVKNFFEENMNLYQDFIKLLNKSNPQNFSLEELSPFLTEEAKKKVIKGILSTKEDENYSFNLVLSDQVEKSFSFFQTPKLISHIHGQDTIDYYFIPNIESFLLFQMSQKLYSFNFLKKKDLQSQKLLIPIPQLSDFLLDEECKSIIILGKFIDDGQFENSEFITNEGYGKETVKILEEIKNNFINFNFPIDECEKFEETK